MTADTDELVLEVGGRRLEAWQDVRVTRGIELCPSSFALRPTERFPGIPSVFSVAPGERCRVLIGDDLVLTGYIDRYTAAVSAREHEIAVVGRSNTQDLVDCAAGVSPGREFEARMTIKADSLLTLATDLCKPFGITVTAPDGEGEPLVSSGDGIPQFSISLGQTPYDLIEEVARWRRLLVMDGTDGNLILAKAGTRRIATGFILPGNVLRAALGFRKDTRFTVYLPAMFAFDQFYDVQQATGGGSTNIMAAIPDPSAFGIDPKAPGTQLRHDGQPRYRPHFVISEQSLQGVRLAEHRAKWEMARRYGRSQSVTVTVPSWRDAGGALWTPNTRARLDIPVLKLAGLEWLITEVSYLRGLGGGTRADITLMPPEAFDPEPTFFAPFDPQVEQARRQWVQQTAGGPGQSGGAGQG